MGVVGGTGKAQKEQKKGEGGGKGLVGGKFLAYGIRGEGWVNIWWWVGRSKIRSRNLGDRGPLWWGGFGMGGGLQKERVGEKCKT